MAMSGGTDDGQPMMEMNTTPLIDVMLVLLIMFIITIPVATHAVNIDLPVATPPTNEPLVDPVKNKIVVTVDNKILWNDSPQTTGSIVTLLRQTKTMNPEPELQFEPNEYARYALSAEVLRIIKASGISKFGFVGNERYRTFEKAE